MNIKEILSRLERIDHKEYSCGFEFADSSTFDEMSRCFEERKILAKEIERLNKQLQLISDEFLKYDWETSSKGQTINQLKNLYYSIFKGSGKE